jgi:hypothetical protein
LSSIKWKIGFSKFCASNSTCTAYSKAVVSEDGDADALNANQKVSWVGLYTKKKSVDP